MLYAFALIQRLEKKGSRRTLKKGQFRNKQDKKSNWSLIRCQADLQRDESDMFKTEPKLEQTYRQFFVSS